MRRIIFCPSESQLPEAELFAKENNLPINVGIFDQIEKIIFDKTKVQVIEVPEVKYVKYDEKVKSGFHQIVIYENDFLCLNRDIFLEIDGIHHKPVLLEKHKTRFLVLETQNGAKDCKIIQDNKVLESFNYDVS